MKNEKIKKLINGIQKTDRNKTENHSKLHDL